MASSLPPLPPAQPPSSSPPAVASSNSPPIRLLFIAYPFQGHLSPIINLAIKLATSLNAASSTTLLTTQHSLFRLLRSSHLTHSPTLSHFLASASSSSSSAAAPLSFHFHWTQLGVDADSDIRLVGLPDGFPPDDDRTYLSVAYFLSISASLQSGVNDFLRSSGCGAFTCIISDSFLPWTQDVANRLGIPRVFFWTQSVAVASAYSQLYSLGYEPFKLQVKRRGESKSFVVDTLPGLPPIDHYDLPFDGPGVPEGPKAWYSDIIHAQFARINEADWVLVNSFDELEGSIARALKPRIPKMLLVGPLNVLPRHLEGKMNGGDVVFRGSVWEDDGKCMAWLEAKPPSSVLFISFGSVYTPAPEAIAEICKALLNIVCEENSKEEEVYALWSCRNCEREAFPSEFWEELVVGKGRVLVVKWASQVEVLSHPATGGFLSHMGWNSTMEGVSNGVPMICCPAMYDQYTNSWSAVNAWEAGVEMHFRREEDIDGGLKLVAAAVNSKEVEAAIRRVMMVGGGDELRKKAASLKSAASRAWASPGGSSLKNMRTFVDYLHGIHHLQQQLHRLA